MAKKTETQGVQQLIHQGKEKGFLTYEEVNDALPGDVVSPDQLDGVLSIFDEMESIAGLERACQVSMTTFSEINKLLAICEAIASDPLCLFYIMVYRETKAHVVENLREQGGSSNEDVFDLFQLLFFSDELIDKPKLVDQLNRLARDFRDHYGDRFSL